MVCTCISILISYYEWVCSMWTNKTVWIDTELLIIIRNIPQNHFSAANQHPKLYGLELNIEKTLKCELQSILTGVWLGKQRSVDCGLYSRFTLKISWWPRLSHKFGLRSCLARVCCVCVVHPDPHPTSAVFISMHRV